MVLLALTWATECWIVQGFTLRVDVGGDVLEQSVRALTRGTARFGIDLLAALSIVFFVASRWLHFLFAGSFLLSLAVLAFYGFYGEPLTWTLISEQFAEGIEAADSASALVDSSWAFLLVGFLAVKISLLEWAVRHPAPANLSVRISALALLAYLFVMLVLSTLWSPSLIGRWASFSFVGNLYGYTTAWLAESLYIDQRFLLAKANAVAHRRSALYGAVPLMAQGAERIVAIQAESLDMAAIDTMLPGGPLMPFLRSLRDSAVFTAIEPVHMTGSSDADFTFLMAVPPNGMIAPYKVAGFDFTGSIIRTARRRGFHTSVYHGNRGTFFSRRSAFRDMGFDQTVFFEEMQPFFLGQSLWGIPDDRVFEIAAGDIAKRTGRSFTFVISLTTHMPYRYLVADRRELFPNPETTQQRYFNSMRYLDRVLEKFIGDLPQDTLTFIYADHASRVTYPTAPGARPQEGKLVPFIVFRKGVASKQLQAEFDAAQKRGPSLLDAAAYFHRHLEELK